MAIFSMVYCGLAFFILAFFSLAFFSASTASAQELDPALVNMAILADDTSFVAMNGAGVPIPAPCYRDAQVSFVASETTTPFWVDDKGEVSIRLVSSDGPAPAEGDTICGSAFALDDLPAAPVAGFSGSFVTEPGRRYWVQFHEEDGPFTFRINPSPQVGENYLLETSPLGLANQIVELVDRDEYPIVVSAGPCAGAVRMSFVADSTETVLTTDDDEHLIGVFLSSGANGGVTDLDLVHCGQGDYRGAAWTQTVETEVGERYWITLDTDDPSDYAYVIVNADDPASAKTAERLALSRVPKIRGFTPVSEDTWSPVDTNNCGPIVARFTITSRTTVLWANQPDGKFALFEAPVDPASGDYEGLNMLVGCDEPWDFEHTSLLDGLPLNSVSSEVPTKFGIEYWVAWTGPAATLNLGQWTAKDILVAVESPIFHRYESLGEQGINVDCEGRLSLSLSNQGLEDSVVTVKVDGQVVDEFSLQAFRSTFWWKDAPTKQLSYDIGTGRHVVEILNDGERVNRWPVEPPCDFGTIQTIGSCLNRLHRRDVIIVNQTDEDATYLVEFSHDTASGERAKFRKTNRVAAKGQGRIAITGRPRDVVLRVDVYRDGVWIGQHGNSRGCSPDYFDQVAVTTSCLGGNGLVRYAISNRWTVPRAWTIEFEGLPNRTTSAVARDVALGGISGRADGEYDMVIRAEDGRVVAIRTVTIDCDS